MEGELGFLLEETAKEQKPYEGWWLDGEQLTRCVILPVRLYLSIHQFVCLCLSLYLCVSLGPCLSLSLCLSIYVSISLLLQFVSLSVSPVCFSVCLFLCACQPFLLLCLFACLSVCLCLSGFLYLYLVSVAHHLQVQ